MTKRPQLSLCLLGVLLVSLVPLSELRAQYKQASLFYTLQDGALLGERIHRHDENEDGLYDFFISAPGATVDGMSNAGKIYLYHSPVRRDSVVLDTTKVILQGDDFNQFTGRRFEPGHFNGDEHIDLAVASPGEQSGSIGRVHIYHGPFEPGTPRSYSDADVTITSDRSGERFGVSIAAVPDWNNDGRDELLVGASEADRVTGWGGAAYLFNNLASGDSLTSQERDIFFTGTTQNGRFGGAVAAFDDLDGDGQADIAIGAHRDSTAGSNSGAVYLFNAPFANETYEDQSAGVKIYGRDSLTFWGANVFNTGDIDGDGMDNMVVASYQENRVAYFQGRDTWASQIKIGKPDQHENSGHTLFGRLHNNRKSGADVEFRGDYNLDGRNDPLIGAPKTVKGFERGAVGSYTMDGRPEENIGYGSGLESRFGAQVEAVDDVYTAPADSFIVNGELTVLKIEDFLISDPRASVQTETGEFSSGLVYLYTGEFKEPESSLSLSPSKNVELGDTLHVEAGYTEGSKPIVRNHLVFGTDTTFLGNGENNANPFRTSYSLDTAASPKLELYVQDSLGFNSSKSERIHFAARPMPFDLLDDKSEDTLEIGGDPSQTVSFNFESTVDTNGYPVKYRLVLGMADTVAELSRRDLNRFDYTGQRPAGLTYLDINEFLKDKGIARQQTVQIYWGVQAYNGVFHTTASQGKLRPLHVVRRGLDPYFRLRADEEPMVLQGRSTQTYTFEWTELQTENTNELVRYNFLLMDEPDNFEEPIYKRRTANSGEENSFKLSFGTVDSLLEATGLRQQAQNDTARLYYSAEAVVNNGQKSWYPTNQSLEKEIVLENLIIVGNPEPDRQLPEEFKVLGNYPNPFNPATTIKYALPEAQNVSLTVYNILGRAVYRWSSSGAVAAGFQSHRVDGSSWSSGIYIYRLRAGRQSSSGKMLLVK